MDVPAVSHSGVACCLNGLSDCVVRINDGWKQRWGMDCPGFCFRGVDNHQFDLNPSLLRPPYPTELKELALLENNLWVEFRLRSKPLLGHHVRSAWEALFVMQQYGLPTRLLDWSGSLAVAAYFAVRDTDIAQDGAVWIMASRYLMEIRGVEGAWQTVVGDPRLEPMALREGNDGLEEFNAQSPMPVRPDQLDPRMIAQREIYTLHTFRRHAMESLAETDRLSQGVKCFLHKIIIPAKAKPGIRSELSVVAGISEETLFPDIEGFARDFVAEQKRKAADAGIKDIGCIFQCNDSFKKDSGCCE